MYGTNVISAQRVAGSSFRCETFFSQPQYAKEMRTSSSRARSGSATSSNRPPCSIHQLGEILLTRRVKPAGSTSAHAGVV